MAIQVLQRYDWHHGSRELGEVFVLKKGSNHCTARCSLSTHILGWELRPEAAGELLRTQVCRSSEEVLNTHEAWKAAMIEKGWA